MRSDSLPFMSSGTTKDLAEEKRDLFSFRYYVRRSEDAHTHLTASEMEELKTKLPTSCRSQIVSHSFITMIARLTIMKRLKAKLETPCKAAKHPDTRFLFRSNVWMFLCFLIQNFTLPSLTHTLCFQSQALQLPQLYEHHVYSQHALGSASVPDRQLLHRQDPDKPIDCNWIKRYQNSDILHTRIFCYATAIAVYGHILHYIDIDNIAFEVFNNRGCCICH